MTATKESRFSAAKLAGMLAACLLLVCSLALAGCSSGKSSSAAESSSAESSSSASESAPPEVESDYAVTIDGMTLGKDYQGEPTAIVTYTWTNNSEKATSFIVALSAKCYQNGVQCESAIGSDWDSQGTMANVKPGATTTVTMGYVLTDSSDITVEVSESFSLKNEILAEATFPVA